MSNRCSLFLMICVTVCRAAAIVARTCWLNRVKPAKLMYMTLSGHDGKLIPLSEFGSVEVRAEEAMLKRRDRLPTMTVQCGIADNRQPPEVTMELARGFK